MLYRDTNGTERKSVDRSPLAQQFHSLVMEVMKSGSEERFAALDAFLNRRRDDYSFLAESSVNGYNVLQDVLHLPYEYMKLDRARAGDTVYRLLEMLIPVLGERLNEEQRSRVFGVVEREGYSLLNKALCTGDGRIVDLIFDAVAAHAPDGYKKLLVHHTKKRWNLFHAAVFVDKKRDDSFFVEKLMDRIADAFGAGEGEAVIVKLLDERNESHLRPGDINRRGKELLDFFLTNSNSRLF